MGKELWSINEGKTNVSDVNSPNITRDTPFPVASISKVVTVSVSHTSFL